MSAEPWFGRFFVLIFMKGGKPMLELLGLMLGLMWQFFKFFFVLAVAIFVPLALFVALCSFLTSFLSFGWKEAADAAKKKLDKKIGRRAD